jgi:hypothetical protein
VSSAPVSSAATATAQPASDRSGAPNAAAPLLDYLMGG